MTWLVWLVLVVTMRGAVTGYGNLGNWLAEVTAARAQLLAGGGGRGHHRTSHCLKTTTQRSPLSRHHNTVQYQH